jgi:hypothetical protein
MIDVPFFSCFTDKEDVPEIFITYNDVTSQTWKLQFGKIIFN